MTRSRSSQPLGVPNGIRIRRGLDASVSYWKDDTLNRQESLQMPSGHTYYTRK